MSKMRLLIGGGGNENGQNDAVYLRSDRSAGPLSKPVRNRFDAGSTEVRLHDLSGLRFGLRNQTEPHANRLNRLPNRFGPNRRQHYLAAKLRDVAVSSTHLERGISICGGHGQKTHCLVSKVPSESKTFGDLGPPRRSFLSSILDTSRRRRRQRSPPTRTHQDVSLEPSPRTERNVPFPVEVSLCGP